MYLLEYLVGNKAKRRISKRVFQEIKARQISWKMNIKTPVLRFAFLLYYQWLSLKKTNHEVKTKKYFHLPQKMMLEDLCFLIQILNFFINS